MRGMTGLFMFMCPFPSERNLGILEQGRRIHEPDFSLSDQDCYYYTDSDGQDSEQAEKEPMKKKTSSGVMVMSDPHPKPKIPCGSYERISRGR